MGGIRDTEKFERFQIKDVGRQIKGNKTNSFLQFLLGGATPFGAKLWSKILGRDLTPFVNQLGGPTDKRFKDARQSGIDTGLSEKSHQVAALIAAYNGAQGIFPAAAPGASSGGVEAGNALSQMFPQAAGEGLGAAASGQALGSTAGVGAGATLGNTPGLLGGGTFPGAVGGSAAPLGNTGAVLGVGGGAGAGGGATGGNNFMDQLQQQRPNLGGQQQQGGGGAMDKVQLIQLMMEIRRLQEEKDAEKRRQLGIGF